MEFQGFVNVIWFLTDACNLRCKHCYHATFSPRLNLSEKQKKLDEKIINDIIQLSKTWEVETIGFLGGEPLLHPHLFSYIEKLSQKIDCRIVIGTNGLLIDDNVLVKIKNQPNLEIQISIDSPIEKDHDFYRGKGMYQRTVKNLKKLITNGVITSIRMTISDINFQSMKKFVEFGIELGVAGVSINKYISDGGKPSQYINSLTPEQHHEFIEKIVSLQKEYGESFVTTEDPCLKNYFKDELLDEFEDEITEGIAVGGCSAGLCSIIIGTDGKIYPCTLLPLEIGNINHSSLVEIWEDEHPILNNLRDRQNTLKGKCFECESKLICGGCRAAAHKMNGHYMAEDPFCNKKVVL